MINIPKTKYRIGYLFFRYILDTPLMEDERADCGKLLAPILEEMGIIEQVGKIVEWDGRKDHWYVYNDGMELPEPEITEMVIEYLKERAA